MHRFAVLIAELLLLIPFTAPDAVTVELDDFAGTPFASAPVAIQDASGSLSYTATDAAGDIVLTNPGTVTVCVFDGAWYYFYTVRPSRVTGPVKPGYCSDDPHGMF